MRLLTKNGRWQARTADPLLVRQEAQSVSPDDSSTSGGDETSPSRFPSSRVQEALRADPELEGLIEAWPELPDALRAGIVAMVKAAQDG